MTRQQEVIAALEKVRGLWTTISKDTGVSYHKIYRLVAGDTEGLISDDIEILYEYLSKPLIEQKFDD